MNGGECEGSAARVGCSGLPSCGREVNGCVQGGDWLHTNLISCLQVLRELADNVSHVDAAVDRELQFGVGAEFQMWSNCRRSCAVCARRRFSPAMYDYKTTTPSTVDTSVMLCFDLYLQPLE